MFDDGMTGAIIPPQNIEAEQAVLGTLLIKPKSVYQAMALISSDDFYKDSHKLIFGAITSLSAKGVNPDLVSVADFLSTNSDLNKVGGPAYLASLTEYVQITGRIKNHCRIISDKAKARRFISIAQDLQSSCYEGKESINDITNRLSSDFITASKEDDSNTQTISEISDNVIKEIKGKCDGSISPYGISTGIHDLDELTGGLQKTDLIVLAARPGLGKTTLALNIATNAAQKGSKVFFFSLEMSKEKLVRKQISSRSGVNDKVLLRGLLNEYSWPKINGAVKSLKSLPITIDDSSALHINQIQARAKLQAMRTGIDLIIVDYLGLARGNSENKTQETTEISAGLKALAKDLKIPVLALAQLNRSVESRTDKRPQLSDLRDSGSIEQDASVVAFLFSERVYDTSHPDADITELAIRKNREGETGMIKLSFDGATSTFMCIEKYQEEQV